MAQSFHDLADDSEQHDMELRWTQEEDYMITVRTSMVSRSPSINRVSPSIIRVRGELPITNYNGVFQISLYATEFSPYNLLFLRSDSRLAGWQVAGSAAQLLRCCSEVSGSVKCVRRIRNMETETLDVFTKYYVFTLYQSNCRDCT